MANVALTRNFLSTARGITIADGGGLTWAFNANTNTLTATGAGGGVLSSVGLADTSSTPIFAVTNSPLIANGTIDITLNTQAPNLVFAGPVSGANAQPTFRGMVIADLPVKIPNANLANSSVTVTAGAGLSGGGAAALGASVTLSLSVPVSAANGGTGVNNGTSTITLGGSLTFSGAFTFTGTLTAATAVTFPTSGTLATTAQLPTAANPSAKVGLSVVNGAAATFMRSDGAPQLDVSISPTWTGNHIYTPTAGIGLTVNGLNAIAGQALAIVGTFTGAGTTQLVQFSDVNNTNGVNLMLTGNGATTPNKFIRVRNGNFALLNSAYSATLMLVSDAGAVTITGSFGINNTTPPTQPTGYGTPTGNALTASFAAGSITLPQLAAEVAQLVLDLKKYGIIAA